AGVLSPYAGLLVRRVIRRRGVVHRSPSDSMALHGLPLCAQAHPVRGGAPWCGHGAVWPGALAQPIGASYRPARRRGLPCLGQSAGSSALPSPWFWQRPRLGMPCRARLSMPPYPAHLYPPALVDRVLLPAAYATAPACYLTPLRAVRAFHAPSRSLLPVPEDAGVRVATPL